MDKRNILIKKKGDRIEKNLFIVGMLLIPLLHFIFFYIYVNFSSFLMAFQRPRYDGSGAVDWGFQNFIMFWEELVTTDSDLLICLRNTLVFFSVDIFIKLPLSLLICYFIYKKIVGKRAFRAIIYLPCIIMSTVFITLYKYMVGTGGPLFAIWEVLGEEPKYFFSSSEYALKAIVFYVIYSGLGGHFILLGGAMNAIDDSIIDAGKIDGVGPFRELISLIIPSIWPTLSTMLLMASIGVFTASGPLLLFTQGEFETNTISFWIYGLTTGVTGYTDYEYASAVGLVFTLCGLPIVLTVKKLIGITKED
ncbi:MAG: sugar ABC transporter permease [Clostridia bacterium]|nr:sugar ABC transporter permease [Clostridia bacterium]